MSINLNSNEIANTGFTSTGYITSVPTVVTSGLVLWYDAGNNASYINSSSYYDCGYGCQYYASNPGCTNCNTQIKDMSGLGNDGTLGSTTISYDNVGGYMNFNGSSYYVNANNPTSLQLSTNITIMAWVNPTSVTGLGNIVAKNANSGFRFRIQSDNTLWWYVSGNYVSGGNVPLNTWSHVTVIGSPSGLSAYVNAISVASNAIAYSPTSASTNNFTIGADTINGEYFNGKISIVQIYNKALNATEVLQNFNAGRQRYGI